jgi:hypothetical protein
MRDVLIASDNDVKAALVACRSTPGADRQGRPTQKTRSLGSSQLPILSEVTTSPQSHAESSNVLKE